MFAALKAKGPLEYRSILKDYFKQLKSIVEDPYERRILDYVDIISWIDSKILNLPLQTYVENKKP